MAIQPRDELPLTFRAETVTAIMHHLAAGDSCAVVGIGSVGKSNLLRFLLRDDVRQAQLGPAWSSYLFVYVDINKILKMSLWGLFELMLHQLIIQLTHQGADEVILQKIEALHRSATEPPTRYLALRYLERAIKIVCHQLELRLVFLIDEFDEFCRSMPVRGFSALRALRDEYKYRLMYLVATRLELKRLRDERLEIEAFEELVASHTNWIGPYSAEDAVTMLHRLEKRHKTRLNDEAINKVLQATGGHPGLLREAYQVARHSPADFFEVLSSRPHVQDECQRIWLSLAPEEQRVMVSLAGSPAPPPTQPQVVEQLRRKGLVGGPWAGNNQIFSSLLTAYIKQQHPMVGAHIHVDRKRHTVWVKGYEIRGLTPLEYRLIAYLEERRGQVCTRDELAQHLYPDDMAPAGAGVTDTRLDSVIKRLRKQIEPNAKEPRYILTVRGHGFRLVDHHDQSDT